MKNNIYLLIIVCYYISLIVATGYVVFILGQSGWWFVLTIVLMEAVTVNDIKKYFN